MKTLTLKQLRWALLHDWAITSCMDEHRLGVEVRNDDPAQSEPLRFYDFQALYAWAGY